MNISHPHHCNQSCTNLAFIRNRDHVAKAVLTSAPRVVISRCKKRRNLIKNRDISKAGHLPSYSRLLEKLRTPNKHPNVMSAGSLSKAFSLTRTDTQTYSSWCETVYSRMFVDIPWSSQGPRPVRKTGRSTTQLCEHFAPANFYGNVR